MTHPHLACVPAKLSELLKEAEDLCSRRGGNLTPLRRRVLELLLESDRPAKAYDVLHRLKDHGEAKPPTVYRSLEFLLEMGLIHRIESLQAFAPCGHWAHGHVPVFLICDGCGSVGEINGSDSVKKLSHEAGSVDFRLRATVIEARGHCGNCT